MYTVVSTGSYDDNIYHSCLSVPEWPYPRYVGRCFVKGLALCSGDNYCSPDVRYPSAEVGVLRLEGREQNITDEAGRSQQPNSGFTKKGVRVKGRVTQMSGWLEKLGLARKPKVSPEVEALVRKVDKTLDRARIEFNDLKLELTVSAPVQRRKVGNVERK